ncbi:MAG: hypothetical protein QM658_03710 [Gordonia sp. (in: high G+C Gram-positive bacteria)]
MEDLIVPVGMAVVVLCLLMVAACVVSMAFSWGTKRPEESKYTLDQPWDRAPALFSATEIEPMALARHLEPGDTDGGSASGKW